jgi:hypothetical protein
MPPRRLVIEQLAEFGQINGPNGCAGSEIRPGGEFSCAFDEARFASFSADINVTDSVSMRDGGRRILKFKVRTEASEKSIAVLNLPDRQAERLLSGFNATNSVVLRFQSVQDVSAIERK